ncbi:MAG: hypothetical protein FWC68_04890 [Oscillospiraceae bacterium]|nr:hypothetical protein [Oscillospiraceae bacterium]
MELISGISNYTVLIVIAGMFLYEHFTVSKKTQEIQKQNSELLKEMKNTNVNTAKALEILQENQRHMINVTERIEEKIDCVKEKANISKKGGD